MPRRSPVPILLTVLTSLLAVMLAVAVNVATSDTLPRSLLVMRPWVWPLVGLLTVATITVGLVQLHHGHPTSNPPPLATPGAEAPSPTVLDRLPRSPTGPLVSNLPPRNPDFTGRSNLLAKLHASLDLGTTAAIVQVQARALHGLGGVGKTQLALEYAHSHAADYDVIWWLTAEQPAAIPTQLVALARRLGLREQTEHAETVQALWDALRLRHRWLLVYDNAEDPRDLRAWWPPASGRVLVTSRTPTWTGLAVTIQVDVLPRPDAVAFLQRRLGRDDLAFDQLAAALGDLPLALEQAAAYLEATSSSPAEYATLLRSRTRELFTLGAPSNSEQTIATTWTVSLDRVRKQTPAAQDLSALLAFVASDDLPRSLLPDHPGTLPDQLAAMVTDPLAYGQTLGVLRRYALAVVTDQTVSMHRLVQAVVRDRLGPDQQQWATAAVGLLLAGFPDRPEHPTTWPVCAQLLPHALVASDHASSLDANPQLSAALLSQAASYLRGRAEHADTRLLFRRALTIRQACLGADHPDTAQTLDNLGAVLSDLGDQAAARDYLERALAIRQARLGADHPDTAASLIHLGNSLVELDLGAARDHFERALVIFETRLGADHPTTAHILDHLGNVLHVQGDLDAARTVHQRALVIFETRLGPDHPDTARSLNHVATVLHDQGDLDRARALHERAIAIHEARLGPDHPDTIRSRQDLAAVVAALKHRE